MGLSMDCKPAKEVERVWTISFITSCRDIMVCLQSIVKGMISFFMPAADIMFSANILLTAVCFYQQVSFLAFIFFAPPQDGKARSTNHVRKIPGFASNSARMAA